MPARNPFIPVDPETDPALVMNTPLPSVPSTPMNSTPGGEATTVQAGDMQPPAPMPSTMPPPNPYGGDGSYVSPAMANSGSGLGDLYFKYYGTHTPDVAAYDANLGNPGGLSAIEKMMQDDPNNILHAASKKDEPSPANQLPTPSGFAMPSSPLGDSVDSGLMDLIGHNGMTPEQTSLLAEITKIIGAGGALPSDSTLEQQQLESARENESAAFSGQLNDARDELASRGLVSEPGVPQGSEGEAISEITRHTAPAYAQAVRDVSTQQIQTQNDRLKSAISAATGLTSDAAEHLVTSLGTGSQRQLGLASIALDSLSQNMQWNEFLANYGLNRDQVLNSIQNGNVGSLMTLLSLFQQVAGLSAAGHI